MPPRTKDLPGLLPPSRVLGKSFCRDRVSESFRPPTRSSSLVSPSTRHHPLSRVMCTWRLEDGCVPLQAGFNGPSLSAKPPPIGDQPLEEVSTTRPRSSSQLRRATTRRANVRAADFSSVAAENLLSTILATFADRFPIGVFLKNVARELDGRSLKSEWHNFMKC